MCKMGVREPVESSARTVVLKSDTSLVPEHANLRYTIQTSLTVSPNLLLNIHEPVILRDPFAPTWGTGLQVTSPNAHGKVCNKVVSGLTRAM